MKKYSLDIPDFLKMSPQEKYHFFITNAVAYKRVWSLGDKKGLVTAEDENETLLLPIWPLKEFAQYYSNSSSWEKCKPISITLDDFINEIIPEIKKDNMDFGIFYDDDDSIRIDIEELKSDLKKEMDRTEISVNKKEIKKILRSSLENRYHYFLDNVIEDKKIWVLEDEEGCIFTQGEDGTIHLPIWPSIEFAEYEAVDEWEDCNSEWIPLDEFIDEWIPKLKKDAIELALYRNLNVDFDGFIEDIESEL